jgi:hypothetical protein
MSIEFEESVEAEANRVGRRQTGWVGPRARDHRADGDRPGDNASLRFLDFQHPQTRTLAPLTPSPSAPLAAVKRKCGEERHPHTATIL